MCAPGESPQVFSAPCAIVASTLENKMQPLQITEASFKKLPDQLDECHALFGFHSSARSLIRFWITVILEEKEKSRHVKRPNAKKNSRQSIEQKAARLEVILYKSDTCLDAFLDKSTLKRRLVMASRKINLYHVNKRFKRELEMSPPTSPSQKRVRFNDRLRVRTII
jgi:hypothetical protein